MGRVWLPVRRSQGVGVVISQGLGKVRKYQVYSGIRGSTCLARAEDFYEEMIEGLLKYWLELISM